MSKFTIKISATLNGKACKNPQVEFIQGEGCIYPCEIKGSEITIETLPGTTDCNCIEGYIKCEDECLNCPPQHFKRCFCESSEDCQDCETCIGGICVPDCPDKMCVNDTCCDCAATEDCPVGFICNGCDCKCLGKINSDGECVECITKADCKECENCIDGECVPIECPNNLICVNGDCGCPPGTVYDPITKTCVPFVCDDDGDCKDCETCISNKCVPVECPIGTKPIVINGVCTCIEWPCIDTKCVNGADCGEGCGCINEQCVPCKYLECITTDCEQALGCECNSLQKCEASNGCKGEYCDDFVKCGTPGCTCYENKCVSCKNFSCENEECANQVGCACKNGKCESAGCNNEPCEINSDCGLGCTCQGGKCKDAPCSGSCIDSNGCAGENCICVDGNCVNNPDGDGCKDTFVLKKNCGENDDDCYLEAVLTSQGCKCADITTKIKLDKFENGKLIFSGDLFKGNANFKDYLTDGRFADNEVLSGNIIYDVVDNSNGSVLQTQILTLNNSGPNVNKFPSISIDIATYKAQNKDITITFKVGGFSTVNNDCIKYGTSVVGSYNFKLKANGSVDLSQGSISEIVKDNISTKKPLFVWYKGGAIIRKVNPAKQGNSFKDKLPEDKTELLANYRVVTDCNGCGPNEATQSNLKFCCLPETTPDITNCATKLVAPAVKICNVNKIFTEAALIINGVDYDWKLPVNYNQPNKPIKTLVGVLRYGGQIICSKEFEVPDDSISVDITGTCLSGNTGQLTLTAENGVLISSILGLPSGATIVNGLPTSTVQINIANATNYASYINSNPAPLVVKSTTNCQVEIQLPSLSGDCGLKLKTTKTDEVESCGSSTKGSITATIDGIGSLTGFTFTLNGDYPITGTTATWTNLSAGTYVVRVVGNGVDQSQNVIIEKSITAVNYTLVSTPACGGNNGVVTLTITNPTVLNSVVTFSLNGSQRQVSANTPVVTWNGLSSGTYNLSKPVLNKFVFCGPDSVQVTNNTQDIFMKIDPIITCAGAQSVPVVLRDATNVVLPLSSFTVTTTGSIFNPSTGTLSINPGVNTATIKFCPSASCQSLQALNASLVLGVDGCLTHTIIVNPLPVVGAPVINCVESQGIQQSQIDVVVSPSVTTFNVVLKNGPSTIGTFVKQGITDVYRLVTNQVGTFNIEATNTITGCSNTRSITIVGCNNTVCPSPINFAPQAICIGDCLNFTITASQFANGNYTGNGNIGIQVSNNGNLVYSKISHNPLTNLDDIICNGINASATLLVRIDKLGCQPVYSNLILTVNPIGSPGCVCTEQCPPLGLGLGEPCPNVILCGETVECPCGPGLTCAPSGGGNVCVPIASYDCGCGLENPGFISSNPITPTNLPCLCNAGNANCPGLFSNCGDLYIQGQPNPAVWCQCF